MAKHLNAGKSITILSAFRLFGCSKPATRIPELKREGLLKGKLCKERINVKTRYGKTSVMRYYVAPFLLILLLVGSSCTVSKPRLTERDKQSPHYHMNKK